MVADLMVPAHCSKKGVTEQGPSSTAHKVSVGSASKHLGKVSSMGEQASLTEARKGALCGENTSPVTPWECATVLGTQLALLVSTRETIASYHWRQRLLSAEDIKPGR